LTPSRKLVVAVKGEVRDGIKKGTRPEEREGGRKRITIGHQVGGGGGLKIIGHN